MDPEGAEAGGERTINRIQEKKENATEELRGGRFNTTFLYSRWEGDSRNTSQRREGRKYKGARTAKL